MDSIHTTRNSVAWGALGHATAAYEVALAYARGIGSLSAGVLETTFREETETGKVDCVFVDEAQFLEEEQVWQLARVADDLHIPVMCYGLRVDFRGELFPGSATLLALADDLREVRTICHCGRKATMVIRRDEGGRAITEGAQVQVGGNETYVSLCRRHWREATGN